MVSNLLGHLEGEGSPSQGANTNHGHEPLPNWDDPPSTYHWFLGPKNCRWFVCVHRSFSGEPFILYRAFRGRGEEPFGGSVWWIRWVPGGCVFVFAFLVDGFFLFKPTPWKTNMSPKNHWLEDVFPIEIVPLGDMLVFGGVSC